MTTRLWTAITSSPKTTRILVTDGPHAPLLKARLRPLPHHPRALPTLLEALALWQGEKVHAVLGVAGDSPMWTSTQLEFVGVDTPLYALDLAFTTRSRRAHDPLSGLGDFRDLHRLLAREVAR
jgi:hypothetical protein